MPIRVPCSGCEKKLIIKDELLGKRVKCPSCGRVLGVPAAGAAPPPQAAGPSPQASRARPRAASPPARRRPRWPWYVGGAAAAVGLVAAVVVVLVAAGRGGGPGTSSGRDRAIDPEKLQSAIRRCGGYGGRITTTDNPSVLFAALEEIEKARGDLGQSFVRAARAAARKQPKASFYLFVSNETGFGLAELRELLGKEDAEQPDSLQITSPGGGSTVQQAVTWYTYGWCSFGIGPGGRVIVLKADCGALPAEAG
jgi:hypothetical protein